jgi:biofilm protein TabA
MIVTDIGHLGEQAALTPALRKALDFLRQVEGQTLADGRIEIDGDNVYAIAQSYQTLEGGVWAFEGHRKYLDVQYVAGGEEIIGWADAACVAITMPYDPSKDAWLGTVPAEQITPVRLRAGQLAVLYPEDAHAPKRAAGLPQPVNKIVVKVITEQ